ncbi:MAG: DUF4358 domain-containing protein [Anaerotruncus sp.]|nr:DUF4358 domain-containing protein [Anaerotruncus sp.]
MLKRRWIYLVLACCILFVGCGNAAHMVVEVEGDVQDSAVELMLAQPQEALDEIYHSVTVKDVKDADDDVLENKFRMHLERLDDYYVRYASGRYGVANVFILEPTEGMIDLVREKLFEIKTNLINEFQSYDIYNSYQIAQDAQIFEQGDYVIMLMLDDNDAAREIIDQYIPK